LINVFYVGIVVKNVFMASPDGLLAVRAA